MGPVPVRLLVLHSSDSRKGDRPTYIPILTLKILIFLKSTIDSNDSEYTQ
jgi:hypothetical protein